MRVIAFPTKKFLGIELGKDSGIVVQVNGSETVITVSNNGNETEYKFPH